MWRRKPYDRPAAQMSWQRAGRGWSWRITTSVEPPSIYPLIDNLPLPHKEACLSCRYVWLHGGKEMGGVHICCVRAQLLSATLNSRLFKHFFITFYCHGIILTKVSLHISGICGLLFWMFLPVCVCPSSVKPTTWISYGSAPSAPPKWAEKDPR